MADQELPPNAQTEPEHSSPAAKKSKSSRSDEADCDLLCLETTEQLATSSDESFGEANEERDKISSSVGQGTSAAALAAVATAEAMAARAGPSTATLDARSTTPPTVQAPLDAREEPEQQLLDEREEPEQQLLDEREEPEQRLLDEREEPEQLLDEQSLVTGNRAYYRRLTYIGDGAYGTVYKAYDSKNSRMVALKQVRVPVTADGLPTSILREIAALKQLDGCQNPQIVKLLDVCQGNYLQNNSTDALSNRLKASFTLWLVFEHVERDLASFIAACKSGESNNVLDPLLIRQMSREILAGVDFLHSHRIVHRDLKPQNLLVTIDDHIKIADFGLAKVYDFHMRLTSVVVTLWYRAPEILLGCTYASPIDIWSVGCILAELNKLQPLFPGSGELDQIERILGIIGSPPQEEWPNDTSLSYAAFPFRHSRPMHMVIPHLDHSGLDLIQNMLIFNPHKRLTAAQALKHPYFTDNEF